MVDDDDGETVVDPTDEVVEVGMVVELETSEAMAVDIGLSSRLTIHLRASC